METSTVMSTVLKLPPTTTTTTNTWQSGWLENNINRTDESNQSSSKAKVDSSLSMSHLKNISWQIFGLLPATWLDHQRLNWLPHLASLVRRMARQQEGLKTSPSCMVNNRPTQWSRSASITIYAGRAVTTALLGGVISRQPDQKVTPMCPWQR